MYTCQHCDWFARIYRNQKWRRKDHAKINIAPRELLDVGSAAAGFHVTDLREALRAQEFLRNVKRREANPLQFRNTNRGHFRPALVRERSTRAENAGGAGGSQPLQEIAAVLRQSHRKSPSRRRARLKPSAHA
jgi:hypothetical protein